MYIFITLALALTVSAFYFRSMMLGFGAVAGWILVAAYGFSLSTGTWDVYYTLAFFSIGLAIAMALMAMGLREKKEPEEERDDLDEYLEGWDEYDKKEAKLRRAIRPGNRRKRLSRLQSREDRIAERKEERNA